MNARGFGSKTLMALTKDGVTHIFASNVLGHVAFIDDVRTVEVEEWLHSLPYAHLTKSKIRNIMSAVFNHAIRYE